MIESNAARYGFIALAALAINVLLFTAIQFMVGSQRMRLSDTTQFDLANFIRMSEQPRDVRSRRDPKAPEKPDTEAQDDLDRLARASNTGNFGGVSVDMPDIDIDIDIGGGIQIARELTPLVRFPAAYPVTALTRRIEGYVIMRFTVTESGSVVDPEVVRGDPPGVFDRAGIRAVLKWKYQPQIVDGKPARLTTYTRLTFEIGKE
ncbi:MAG: energy transducer TonB [Woeseiaceae bacterium]